MKVTVVYDPQDKLASLFTTFLPTSVEVVDDPLQCKPGMLAVFGLSINAHATASIGSKTTARVVPFRFDHLAPGWAQATAFQIALRNNRISREQVLQIVALYQKWIPNGHLPPWGAVPTSDERIGIYNAWLARASKEAAGYIDWESVLLRYGCQPVYRTDVPTTTNCPLQVAILTCASPANTDRTDFALGYDYEKLNRVADLLNNIRCNLPNLENFRMVIADGSMTQQPGLTNTLHPFAWIDLEQLDVTVTKRIIGHSNQRTPEQLAHALNLSADSLLDSLAVAGVNLTSTSWMEFLGQQRLAEQFNKLPEFRDFAEIMHSQANGDNSWYVALERALGYGANITRLENNIAVYVAVAQKLQEEPNLIILTAEQHLKYWYTLEEYLKSICSDIANRIWAMPSNARQHWSVMS